MRTVTFLARVYVVCARNKLILGGLGSVALTCVVLDAVSIDTRSVSTNTKPSIDTCPRAEMQGFILNTDVRPYQWRTLLFIN